jgi:hypothetical protein
MGGAGYIVTLVNDLPGCWPLDADERFEKRALAGAVRADNTMYFTFRYRTDKPLSARTPP